MEVIRAEKLTKVFGGLVAVSEVSMSVSKGEIAGLIGPNGAGKTTLFNLLTGVFRPSAGSIYICGENATGMRPDRIAVRGVARTFQSIRVFRNLSVLDNVLVAFHAQARYGLFAPFVYGRRFLQDERTIRGSALQYLERFDLDGKKDLKAGDLSLVEQRKLEILRAMASFPKVLLLDEPVGGMNAEETRALVALVSSLRDEYGIGVLLIEHVMGVVMGVCERVIVLNQGRVIATGTPTEIQSNEEVIRVYLGEEASHA